MVYLVLLRWRSSEVYYLLPMTMSLVEPVLNGWCIRRVSIDSECMLYMCGRCIAGRPRVGRTAADRLYL